MSNTPAVIITSWKLGIRPRAHLRDAVARILCRDTDLDAMMPDAFTERWHTAHKPSEHQAGDDVADQLAAQAIRSSAIIRDAGQQGPRSFRTSVAARMRLHAGGRTALDAVDRPRHIAARPAAGDVRHPGLRCPSS
ncbi:MAG: hypothetical protein H6805_12490 [Planctomycetes bacterium]|nr:hypothetical protein [Planctomycetota bacterium]